MREEVETTVLSTKGQVVIPETIRDRMHLKPGSKFIVVSKDDTLMLKKVKRPRFEGFDEMIRENREIVKKNAFLRRLSKMSEEERMEEINKLIHKIRKRK